MNTVLTPLGSSSLFSCVCTNSTAVLPYCFCSSGIDGLIFTYSSSPAGFRGYVPVMMPSSHYAFSQLCHTVNLIYAFGDSPIWWRRSIRMDLQGRGIFQLFIRPLKNNNCSFLQCTWMVGPSIVSMDRTEQAGYVLASIPSSTRNSFWSVGVWWPTGGFGQVIATCVGCGISGEVWSVI